MHAQARLRLQANMAILRHLRCDVSIGGEYDTYDIYIYRPIGRTRAGLATPNSYPRLLPSPCDETVALDFRPRSSALRASSGSNRPLEPLEAPRVELRGLPASRAKRLSGAWHGWPIVTDTASRSQLTASRGSSMHYDYFSSITFPACAQIIADSWHACAR